MEYPNVKQNNQVQVANLEHISEGPSLSTRSKKLTVTNGNKKISVLDTGLRVDMPTTQLIERVLFNKTLPKRPKNM
jgi:hypothetical protein